MIKKNLNIEFEYKSIVFYYFYRIQELNEIKMIFYSLPGYLKLAIFLANIKISNHYTSILLQ